MTMEDEVEGHLSRDIVTSMLDISEKPTVIGVETCY